MRFRFFAAIALALPSITIAEVTEHGVLPILLRRCGNCHGATYQEGGLDLRSRESILKGGENGAVIVFDEVDSSPILQKIAEKEMPPEKSLGRAGIERPTAEEIATLREWIVAGAPETPKVIAESKVEPNDRDHWSFQPPKKADAPKFAGARNEIDGFLLAKLTQQGLEFSPEAESAALLRRATFALTGLPASPDEIRQFSPANYEATIEKLLNSPRYGEKWGRMWLDLAAGFLYID